MKAAADINGFNPIAEESAEEDEEEEDADEAMINEAYRALDELRDAEDELEYMEQWRSWTGDMEEAAAMRLWHSCDEEEDTAPREVVKKLSPHSGGEKVVKPLSHHYIEEVVKSLRTAEKQLAQPLRRAAPADLPADYSARTEQEKIDTFKNQDFGRRYERRQEELLQEQTSRAHAAIAGRTSYRVLSDPKNANPGTPSGQDLDF